MMKRKLTLIILLVFFSITLVFASAPNEIISDFSEESVPVLNNLLRRMLEDVGDFTDTNTDIYVGGSSGDTGGYLDAKVKNSIEVDSNDLQLVGDSASPGNSKLYGTNSGGTKGWYSQPSASGTSELFTSDGTFTSGVGVTTVYVTLCGGGGGGGGGDTTTGGDGGGGGAYAIKVPMIVTAETGYTVEVALAGTAGTGGGPGSGGAGGNGGYSLFTADDSVTVTATGGIGATAVSGGAGAGGAASANQQIITNAGRAGSASNGGNGGDGAGSFAGIGGNNGVSSVSAGSVGYGYGVGGGGGGANPGTGFNGAAGKGGMVLVEW